MNRINGQAIPQDEVERIISTIQGANYKFWLDGGWGVDALLGKQTRRHKDLDICIKLEDASLIRNLLEQKGYIVKSDESPARLVMHDSDGYRIDLHLLSFNKDGPNLSPITKLGDSPLIVLRVTPISSTFHDYS